MLFTATVTVRTISRDGVSQDGHLDFLTAPELCSSLVLLLRPQRPYGPLLGAGSPGQRPRLSHNSGALGNESMGRLYIHI